MAKKALVLLSGGLDSTTALAIAKKENFEVYTLTFDYGQRHKIELELAQKNAEKYQVKDHKIVKIDLRIFGNSALTDEIDVPKKNKNNFSENSEIPITYVPARNTIFLSYALAFAEVREINNIFIGVNSIDYSGYPDCRIEFIDSFSKTANLATKVFNRQNPLKIHTPLINLSKAEIIKKGIEIGVDYSLTHSCYDPKINEDEIISCGECDSCFYRLQGFSEADFVDPIKYQKYE
jgi:7-cyano-7-deazaguanine synthase